MELKTTVINEDIAQITSGYRTTAERVAYEYAKIEKKHKYRFLFDPLRLLNQAEYITSYNNGQNQFPKSVEIDPSNACNHDCVFCIYHSLHHAGRRERIDDELLLKIIYELKELGCESLLFVGGGEPMTHKKSTEAIALADNLGISVGLVTNGSLVKPEIAEILKNHLTYIRFSFDAAKSETHFALHKKNDFSEIVANLKHISSLKGKCTVGTGFFINEDNYHEVLDNAILVKDCGAEYVQFKSYSGIEIPESWYEPMLLNIEKTFNLSDNSFDVHVMDRIFDNNSHQVRGYSKCHWQAFKTIIGADGNVFLCAQKRTSTDGIIGNINDHSLTNIWNSDTRKKTIENLELLKCPYCVHDKQNKIIEFFNSFQNPHKSFL